MRFVVLFVVLALGVALFVYPPLLEGTDSECSALEQRVTDLASHDSSGRLSVGALYGSNSSNPSGAAYSKDHYPLLPPAVGCVLVYWRTAIDPRFLIQPAAPAAPTPDPPARLNSAAPPATEPKRANAGTAPIHRPRHNPQWRPDPAGAALHPPHGFRSHPRRLSRLRRPGLPAFGCCKVERSSRRATRSAAPPAPPGASSMWRCARAIIRSP